MQDGRMGGGGEQQSPPPLDPPQVPMICITSVSASPFLTHGRGSVVWVVMQHSILVKFGLAEHLQFISGGDTKNRSCKDI